MGNDIKVLRKLAASVESSTGIYNTPDYLLPITSGVLKQEYDKIEDESIVGVAFKALPAMGMYKVTGQIAGQFDVATSPVVLESAMGSVSTGVYALPTTKNEKSLSFVIADQVKTNKYAGCFVNNFVLKSQAAGDLNWSFDTIGYVAEVRDDEAFPTVSHSPGTRLMHQHASGTNGYFRVGDQADALGSGDNLNIDSIEIGVNWQFDFQATNSRQSLKPLSGSAGRPEVTLKFVVSRHDSNALFTLYNAGTSLQAAIKYYAGAAANLLVEFPNLVITEISTTDDDVAKLDVTCAVARNGIGSSYDNSNMAFNSPIRLTLVNA